MRMKEAAIKRVDEKKKEKKKEGTMETERVK